MSNIFFVMVVDGPLQGEHFRTLCINVKGRSEAVNQMKEGETQTTQWLKEKDKSTNNDLQDITQKTKDRAT
jgi:hypothetical protein